MKKKTVLTLLRYVVLLIVVGVLVVFILKIKERNANQEGYVAPPPAVTVVKPTIDSIEASFSLPGHIEADAMIPVIPLVPGVIMEYPVTAGAYVTEGEVLAVIDEAPYVQQMLQAEAAYLVAQSTFERVEGLYQSGATTLQNYEQVKAQRDAMKAQYDLAALQVSYATVTAPVSGTVLIADSAKGSIAAQQYPLAVIADLEHLVVRLQIPERYFELFNRDRDSITLTVTRPGSTISEAVEAPAIITSIAPYIDPQAKTFMVTCRLSDLLEDFRPGMYVRIKISYDRRDFVPVLAQSVRTIDGGVYIWDEADGRVHRVDFIPEVENEYYFMVPELYRETWILTEGQHTVLDNQQVTVINREGRDTQ